MRVRTFAVSGVVVLSAAVLGAPTSEAATGRVCASYLTHDSAIGVTSQNFETPFDAYDAVAADDLQVTRRCRARVVTLVGQYGDATGPARSETLTFYRDNDGRPGQVISSQTVVGDDAGGTIVVRLDRAVRLKPARTYWIAAEANMDFACCGQWSWEIRSTVDGSDAVWKNPGDGFATGCGDWTRIADCLPDRPGDLMFGVRTR